MSNVDSAGRSVGSSSMVAASQPATRPSTSIAQLGLGDSSSPRRPARPVVAPPARDPGLGAGWPASGSDVGLGEGAAAPAARRAAGEIHAPQCRAGLLARLRAAGPREGRLKVIGLAAAASAPAPATLWGAMAVVREEYGPTLPELSLGCGCAPRNPGATRRAGRCGRRSSSSWSSRGWPSGAHPGSTAVVVRHPLAFNLITPSAAAHRPHAARCCACRTRAGPASRSPSARCPCRRTGAMSAPRSPSVRAPHPHMSATFRPSSSAPTGA